MRRFALAALTMGLAGTAHAHPSEQGFVLLLPTGMYIAGGVASVVLTVLLISAVPARLALRLFHPMALGRNRWRRAAPATSCLVFAVMIALLAIGVTGPHDPTRNALPLAVWSVFWFAFVMLQGMVGDLWRWLNPWTGPWLVVRRAGLCPVARWPAGLGHWPALVSFLAFAAVLLAHPAPSDPEVLTTMVASYWGFHFAAMVVFGPKWLRRAEGMTVLLRNYADVAAIGSVAGRLRIGLPGWKTLVRPAPAASLAVFMVTMLAVGSFDGLNETFWWFARIGLNPLEFPGRSAVIAENLAGLGLAVVGLVGAYALVVWLGVRLVGQGGRFAYAFGALAPAILPIALGYHFGHYLPSFLVEIQYIGRAVADALQLQPVQVTTGFFNTLATVRVIWLSQAGAVVVGHVLAILLSHVLALRMFGSHRKAAISQAPLATFMVSYTLFGLWLLASPRGV